MKISYRWLSQYIDLPESVDDLKRYLTFSGIEVEGIQTIPALPESVVSAKVVSAEKLEGSDHLIICKVDAGNGAEPYQVVCGAPNCQSGMIGILALPGTQLKDLLIKKTKLRGIESSGMLCSERELGISDNHAGIIELAEDTPIGISVNELYDLPDSIFELEITPNRSDLLGYFGIARDLSASMGKALKLPTLPDIPTEICETQGLKLILKEPELCPRYTARLIFNVTVCQSPLWLKSLLIKSGLRPINNIVDITIYVMLATGHPLHAFDYHTLAKMDETDPHPAIVVRKAFVNEPFAALDGKDYILEGDELVIADGEKASAIAGVVGGRVSAITDETTAIVLESAAFYPGSIRKTAFKHKISTDSSYRFERHLCDFTPPHAGAMATKLILELAGGEVINGLYDAYPKPWQPQYLALRPRRFEQIIGYKMP
ncbi:MAG: phenylalanine--tRNA ligase subunit beta, partial [Candidatus Cloacimonadaceae bacterium]|nr:phenylalanine--tRNA ligase subunit beta [Candidatus Cloacimonadaceae bacterium]